MSAAFEIGPTLVSPVVVVMPTVWKFLLLVTANVSLLCLLFLVLTWRRRGMLSESEALFQKEQRTTVPTDGRRFAHRGPARIVVPVNPYGRFMADSRAEDNQTTAHSLDTK